MASLVRYAERLEASDEASEEVREELWEELFEFAVLRAEQLWNRRTWGQSVKVCARRRH